MPTSESSPISEAADVWFWLPGAVELENADTNFSAACAAAHAGTTIEKFSALFSAACAAAH